MTDFFETLFIFKNITPIQITDKTILSQLFILYNNIRF